MSFEITWPRSRGIECAVFLCFQHFKLDNVIGSTYDERRIVDSAEGSGRGILRSVMYSTWSYGRKRQISKWPAVINTYHPVSFSNLGANVHFITWSQTYLKYILASGWETNFDIHNIVAYRSYMFYFSLQFSIRKINHIILLCTSPFPRMNSPDSIERYGNSGYNLHKKMQFKIGMLKLASLLRHSWDAACFKQVNTTWV